MCKALVGHRLAHTWLTTWIALGHRLAHSALSLPECLSCSNAVCFQNITVQR